MKGCTGKYFLLRTWLLQAKDRVGAKARGGNRPGPEQGMRGQELGLGEGLAGAGCSCNGARPDPHTLLSARINNYLNFFHLSRDRNTGKHGKGKGIDPSQLLPTPPHCSHRSPHRAIWPSLPPGLSAQQKLTVPHSDIHGTSKAARNTRRLWSPQQPGPSSVYP